MESKGLFEICPIVVQKREQEFSPRSTSSPPYPRSRNRRTGPRLSLLPRVYAPDRRCRKKGSVIPFYLFCFRSLVRLACQPSASIVMRTNPGPLDKNRYNHQRSQMRRFSPNEFILGRESCAKYCFLDFSADLVASSAAEIVYNIGNGEGLILSA